MSILDDLPRGFDRHRDALAIVEGRACNPNVAAVTMLRKSYFHLISFRKSRLSAT